MLFAIFCLKLFFFWLKRRNILFRCFDMFTFILYETIIIESKFNSCQFFSLGFHHFL